MTMSDTYLVTVKLEATGLGTVTQTTQLPEGAGHGEYSLAAYNSKVQLLEVWLDWMLRNMKSEGYE